MAHRFAPEAVADLDAIWYYVATESGNVEIADRLIDSIAERFLLLASFPPAWSPARRFATRLTRLSRRRVHHLVSR